MVRIAPSILAADFLRLGEQVGAVERGGADRLHVDVMDGRFVPNLSVGIPVVESLRGATSLNLETYLMIEAPDRYVEAFVRAGADTVIVHQEAVPHLHRTVHLIKSLGKPVGVALNPATPAAVLDEILPDLDLILVMTVNPGFGGQRFVEATVAKIARVRRMLAERNPICELEVDGGIDPDTAQRAVEAGADVLVAGSAVFGHREGPAAGVARLRRACDLPLAAARGCRESVA